MTKPRLFTDEEQIAVIDGAVADGWTVQQVDISADVGCTVKFARLVKRPDYPDRPASDPYRFPSLETVTQEWGCGLAAARHAKDIMDGYSLAA